METWKVVEWSYSFDIQTPICHNTGASRDDIDEKQKFEVGIDSARDLRHKTVQYA